MQHKHIFTINKIVIFVVFISAAIMTSLFIFHSSHKAVKTTLSSGNGTLLPAAREIKSFKLVTANQQKFSQNDFRNHWTLLFFGFTHCSNVCPATLDMINRAYDKLHADYPSLQVVLISLDPDRDTPTSVADYAHSFNANFIGVTGKIQEIRKLQSQLHVISIRDPESSENNYQLQHSSSILLINPEGKWAGIFKFGMKPDEFVQAFDESVKSLSAA